MGKYAYTVIQFTRGNSLGDSDTLELGMGSSMPILQFLYSVKEDTLAQPLAAPLRTNRLTPALPNKSGFRNAFQKESVIAYVSF